MADLLTLRECAAKAVMVENVISDLLVQADGHGLVSARNDETEGCLIAMKILADRVWAGFYAASRHERESGQK